MIMDHTRQRLKYLIPDLLSALFSWILFFLLYPETGNGVLSPPFIAGMGWNEFYRGLALTPVVWAGLYLFLGFYRDVFRRSRLKEIGYSIIASASGTVIIIAFLFGTGMAEGNLTTYFRIMFVYFGIHFAVSYIPRLAITSATTRAIRKGRLGFNTLIIGSDRKAVEIFSEINNQIRPTGNKFIGYININGNNSCPMDSYLPRLGSLDDIDRVIEEKGVEEVIIAIEPSENGKIERIMNRLDHPDLVIKAIPGMHDILTGRVRINTIIATPLIQLSHHLMPVWQRNLKQVIDIILSVIALVALLPVSIAIALWIKIDSKGPVIYSHERIGRNGKPFRIYKFRTMIDNAEKNGPELSSENDRRVTCPGRFLRKTRLDEIPNFFNVLKGEMSVVGPRPERKFFIDRIVEKAPHYKLLLRIKPGITSWGQVRYGYAENVDQMIQRLKYDMIYLENMSVFVDFQILIHTILTVFRRKGV